MKPSPTQGMTYEQAKKARRIARRLEQGKKPGLIARFEGVSLGEVTAIAARFDLVEDRL